MLKRWNELNRKINTENFIFKHVVATRENPRNGEVGDFHLIHIGNWVNVVARTTQGQFIFVRQYRHGIEDMTLECVAGALHGDEDPLIGGRRELLEETGMDSSEWTNLGTIHPNPALMNNRCTMLFADNCKKVGECKLDKFEDLEVLLLSEKEVREGLLSGVFSNALAYSTIITYFFRESL